MKKDEDKWQVMEGCRSTGISGMSGFYVVSERLEVSAMQCSKLHLLMA